MKAPTTQANWGSTRVWSRIPRHPKYMNLAMGSDTFKFADIITDSTTRWFICYSVTDEMKTLYKVRLYRENYTRLLYYWLYFRFVMLVALGDMCFADFRWYRKRVGGIWSRILLGDDELYCRMWVRGKALDEEVLKQESYPIKF